MTTDIFMQVLLSGMACAGLVTIFGFGVSAAIDLFKHLGGVR